MTPSPSKSLSIITVAAIAGIGLAVLGSTGNTLSAQTATHSDPCIAFKMHGVGHSSVGNEDLMGAQFVTLNKGNGLIGNAFKAPRTGIYFFTINFQREPYPTGATSDDVYMKLYRAPGGSTQLTQIAEAWAGESSHPERQPASDSVVVRLNKGDVVSAYSGSDGGLPRVLSKYNWSGFLICPE